MYASTGADLLPASSIEQSAMYYKYDRSRNFEDVTYLGLDAVLLVEDRVLLTRGLGTVSIMDGVITSLRSAGRSLVDMSGHN